MKIITVVERITPKKAMEYLQHNIPNNRKISMQRVNIYADTMRLGAWELNGEPIIFNEDGYLIDGQTRLTAIIKAGIPIELCVTRGVARDVTNLNRGQSRTTGAALVMAGAEKKLVNNQCVGMAKLYMNLTGICTDKMPADVVVHQFLLDNKEMVLKSYDITVIKKSSVTLNSKNSVLQTAIFGALINGESESKLKRFIEVYATGLYNGKSEQAAIICRNDVINHKVLPSTSSFRQIACRQFEKAIHDFCTGVSRKRSYEKSTEPVYIIGAEQTEEA